MAVGESEVERGGATGDGELVATESETGSVAEVIEGSGVGDTAGSVTGVSECPWFMESVGTSTVPIMGLIRSSAKDLGVTIKMQRITRAMMAFFIVDSGVLHILTRVINMTEMVFSGRVLPE